MIPAATVPQIPQTACTPSAPCWVAGLGFRPIEDTGTACALDDRPIEGKAATCENSLSALLMTCAPEQRAASVADAPLPAPVPLPPSAVCLLAAVVLLAGRSLWRAAGRFGDWFTAERGTGPGKNGWL